jgi:hypothetical protein
MVEANLTMDFGLDGRAYHELDLYEHFVWAERCRAYGIFPNDRDDRNAYLAFKSADRIRALEARGPTYGIPLSVQRSLDRKRGEYLREERKHFKSLGGMETLLYSFGRDVYSQYEAVFNLHGVVLMRIAANLAQQFFTPDLKAPGSLSKAIALVSDSMGKTRDQARFFPKFHVQICIVLAHDCNCCRVIVKLKIHSIAKPAFSTEQ